MTAIRLNEFYKNIIYNILTISGCRCSPSLGLVHLLNTVQQLLMHGRRHCAREFRRNVRVQKAVALSTCFRRCARSCCACTECARVATVCAGLHDRGPGAGKPVGNPTPAQAGNRWEFPVHTPRAAILINV